MNFSYFQKEELLIIIALINIIMVFHLQETYLITNLSTYSLQSFKQNFDKIGSLK